ncbi:hypothetical protein D3C86_298810 [compost metagenome]
MRIIMVRSILIDVAGDVAIELDLLLQFRISYCYEYNRNTSSRLERSEMERSLSRFSTLSSTPFSALLLLLKMLDGLIIQTDFSATLEMTIWDNGDLIRSVLLMND